MMVRWIGFSTCAATLPNVRSVGLDTMLAEANNRVKLARANNGMDSSWLRDFLSPVCPLFSLLVGELVQVNSTSVAD